MERVYGIVANPKAGLSRGSWRQLMAVQKAALTYDNVSFISTDELGQVSRALVKLIAEKRVSMLFVFGGDGTVHKIVDILNYEFERGRIPSLPTICSLGGGTMNAIHKSWLGWDERPVSVFKKVMRAGDDLPLRKLRPLQIVFTNNQTGKPEKRYGFMFIMGAINRIIFQYDQQGRSLVNGLKNFMFGAIASLTGWPAEYAKLTSQFRARMSINGHSLAIDEPLSIVAAVTENLIFGIKPFARRSSDPGEVQELEARHENLLTAKTDDGRYDWRYNAQLVLSKISAQLKSLIRPQSERLENNEFYTVAYEIPASLLVWMIPLVFRATLVPQGGNFFNQPVANLRIIAQSEIDFHLDGDFYPAKPGQPIDISLGPEILMIRSF